MGRGFVTLLTASILSLGSVSALGDLHSGSSGGIASRHQHHGLTPGGRHFGIGKKRAIYPDYNSAANPYLGGSYFPTSNYLSPTTSYPGYSMGYWSPIYGNIGLCYKQPGLYSNYQYGPYNYGYSPYNYGTVPYGYGTSPYGYGISPYTYGSYPSGYGYSSYGWPSSGSCYGLGMTYSPCGNNIGLLYAVNPNQPRILGVSF